ADGGTQNGGFAVGRHHGAVGLAGDLARFEDQLAAAPLDFLTGDFEHSHGFFFLLPPGPAPDCALGSPSGVHPCGLSKRSEGSEPRFRSRAEISLRALNTLT